MLTLGQLKKQFGIGLTGGLASGKSTVADILTNLGYVVIDADQLAKEAAAPGSGGLILLEARFGKGILLPNGELNRPRMREIVFADPEKKRDIESILHPMVHDLLDQKLRSRNLLENPKIWFYDIPLLYETGSASQFRQVWLTYCSQATQIKRAMARDGISAELAARMIASQQSLEGKKAKADVLIDTDQPLTEVKAQVERLVAELEAKPNHST